MTAEKQTFSDAGFYFEYYTVADYDAIAAELAICEANRLAAHRVFKSHVERNKALEAALREARRWIGDGDLSDGLHRGHWTPAYAAAVDLVDATLGSQSETKGVAK